MGVAGIDTTRTRDYNMVSNNNEELRQAADRISRLADLVEMTGLNASDVGQLLLTSFRQSPVEHSGKTRGDVLEMTDSAADSATFVIGLRLQADSLRNLAGEQSG